MGRLTGKVAIITGASAGIGRATAALLAAEGAKVVLGARRAAELDRLVAEIEASGGEAAALAGDVRVEDYARGLVALAVERFGKLDIGFNNAGTLGESGPSTEVSEAGWSDAIAINLTDRSWVPSTASTVGALPRLGRRHLHHRDSLACGWRGLDHPQLTISVPPQAMARPGGPRDARRWQGNQRRPAHDFGAPELDGDAGDFPAVWALITAGACRA